MWTPPATCRILIAPCGCAAAADATDGRPGFCRTRSEAAEDERRGFREETVTWAEFQDVSLGCEHQPKWGVAS